MSEIVTTDLCRFRRVTDGQTKWFLWECPNCKEWCGLSKAQWDGTVSVHHDCGYHEMHNFGSILSAAMIARALTGQPISEEDMSL